MKRLLLQTFTLLTLGVYLHASPLQDINALNIMYYDDMDDLRSLYYNGPRAGIFGVYTDSPRYQYRNEEDEYHAEVRKTTLGILACYADVIGVGRIERTSRGFTVLVDHALVGCTNGVPLDFHVLDIDKVSEYDLPSYIPTNNSRMVFAVPQNFRPDKWPARLDRSA